MAEDVNVVDPDAGAGYNYDSLYDWEAGEQADIDTPGTQAIAKCRCTGGTADTTAVAIDGWTTSAADYIKIWTDPSESYRHAGTYPTGNKYRHEITAASEIHNIEIKENYVKIEGLAIKGIHAASHGHGIKVSTTGDFFTLSSCLIVGDLGSSAYYNFGIEVNSANTTTPSMVVNCIIYNWGTGTNQAGIKFTSDTGSTEKISVYSTTIVDCASGIDVRGGTITCTNVLVKCTDGFEVFSGTLNTSYCASSINDYLGGTGDRNSQTFTFVNEAADDFHLASNDAGALGYGLNLYNDATYPFQTDIDGQDRGGAAAVWDIGADEYVAAGGSSIVPILLHQYRARRD